MVEVDIATELEATADEAWHVLTDLPRYAAWNPFIRRASGDVRVGARVCVRPRTSFGFPLRFTPTIVACQPPHLLCWRGHALSPRVASGDHVFTIETLGRHHVRVVQHMAFDGWLLRGVIGRVLGPQIVRETRAGFAAMNRALGAQVARLRAAAAPSVRARPEVHA